LGSRYGHFKQEPSGLAVYRESQGALYAAEPAPVPGSIRDAQDHESGDVQIAIPVPKNDHL
jgi:hypothetical protein